MKNTKNLPVKMAGGHTVQQQQHREGARCTEARRDAET